VKLDYLQLATGSVKQRREVDGKAIDRRVPEDLPARENCSARGIDRHDRFLPRIDDQNQLATGAQIGCDFVFDVARSVVGRKNFDGNSRGSKR
jgi:hypothetical protein